MSKIQNGEMGQNSPFARIVAGKGFTRCDTDMNGAGIVACKEYSCQGRTFRFLELLGAKQLSTTTGENRLNKPIAALK